MWRFLKRAFTRDVPLKLGSVALAVLTMTLILAVRMERRTFKDVKVEYTGLPANMKPPDWGDRKIDLTMRGPRDILDEVTGKLSVQVSLADAAPGPQEIRLTPEDVRIEIPPAHRRRIQVDSNIKLWIIPFDLELYTAWVAVATPSIEGTPAPGYYSDPSLLEIYPSRIQVTAAPRVLKQLEETGRTLPLQTGAVYINGASREEFSRTYRVDFDAVGVEPVNPEDRLVNVVIRLERTDFRRDLVVDNVQVKNKPENAEVTYEYPGKIRVTVEGRKSLVESLTPGDLVAVVDASQAVGATGHVAVGYHIEVPAGSGLKVISRDPETIDLKVVTEGEGNNRKRPRPAEGASG